LFLILKIVDIKKFAAEVCADLVQSVIIPQP